MSILEHHPCLRRALIFFSMLLLVLSCGRNAGAQSESGRAAITGRVTDATGGVIPNAMITVTATQTGQTRTLTSDGAGFYSVPSLPVGTYSIVATEGGFGVARVDGLQLTVGQTAEINIVMKPAALANTVTVTADETDLTHRTETDNATVLNNEVVEDLSTRGRNFTDFALLTPGISQELDRFGLVVNGQRSGNSNISIDGVDFNDPLQNGQRGGSEAVYFFPQVAVREFEIVRTGASPEVGRTNAGFVNVVTKSGTNRFHGEALYTNRNPWLTWTDGLNDPEANNNQNQYAFGIGGPILRDKLFFFAGVEKTKFEVPFFVIFNSCPTAGYYDPTGLNPTCTQAATGSPNPLPAFITNQEVPGYGFNNPLASSARLDYTLNDHNTLMMQYMSTFLSGLAFGSSGIQSAAASNNTTYSQQSQAIVAGLTSMLSSNRTNDLHVQWVYDNRQQVPNTPGAEIDIGDLGTLGGNAGGTNLYRAIREEAIDNYSWLIGRHSIKFGVDINIEPETQQREDNANGLWTIDTFQDYLKILPVSQGGQGLNPQSINTPGCAGAVPNSCQYQFMQILPLNGGPEQEYKGTQHEYAGYIVDTYHVVANLTLNFGLRYEVELEPRPVANPAIPGTGIDPSDLTQWQPRVGLAWDVFGSGRTVIRASSGLFDARTPAYIVQRDFTDNGLYNASINSNYDQSILTKVAPLGAFTSVPSTNILDDIYVQNPAFHNPRSLQVALAVEQRIDKHTAIVAAFTQNETWDLQHRLNTNLFQPTINPLTLYPTFPSINPNTGMGCSYGGGAIPCYPNPTIAGFHQNFSTAHSTYRSLIVQLRHSLTHHLEFTANYTWASSRDDDSNERDFDRELALDPLCTACYNRGYSKQDIRNQFNINGVYHLPWRFIFSTSFIARTALPYTAVLSGSHADENNDGNADNDRPILCSQIRFTVCSNTVYNSSSDQITSGGTVAGRDTFRQDGFLNWDMRLIKEFRIEKGKTLQFSAECLNCSRSSNLNLGANEVSKFKHAQATINPATGYYYTGNNAGLMLDAYDTFRSGGPRQIQLGARFIF
jgi:hypothetical protein